MTGDSQMGHSLRHIPSGIWVLGFVSLLMDISSEMIHSLLPLFMVTGKRKGHRLLFYQLT